MADYSVSTAEELMSALSQCINHDESDTVTLTADIDFNNSPYYNWNSDFISLYTSAAFSGKVVTIDGDGHKLTNIYCKSGNKVLYLGIFSGTINIKNLTIEAITTNGTVALIIYPTNFENVTFNIKAYNEDNGLFILSMANKINFTNCIFNIYLTNTSNTSMILFRMESSGTSLNTKDFYSCIFKIRNATDSYLCLFNIPNGTYLENCAIFYNEVGTKTPDYTGSYYSKISLDDIAYLINTYIAAFGTVTKKPKIIITAGNNTSYGVRVQSCFVDADKINPYVNDYNNPITPSSGTVEGVTALTTEQCKDKDKLSEIGYIFAEET